MKKREAQFQSKFNRWLIYNWFSSAVFELKVATGKSLPFSAVKNHQEVSLMQTKSAKFIYKISDFDRMKKPFDSFCLYKTKAYIVIMFYRRGNKAFYMIDIDKFIEERILSKRKSLTEEDCKRIGKTYYLK